MKAEAVMDGGGMNGGMPDILTVNEVAGYMRVHRKSVELWIKTGKLKAANLGNFIRIRRADLENLFANIQRKEG